MIVFDGFQLIGLAIFAFIVLILCAINLTKSFIKWSKTGFCKHKFKLERTNSFGQHHWYKCEKCGEERLE